MAPTRPLHADEAAFLEAIFAAPEEDAARLAYADWLDEQGHPARARYIRWRILGLSALGIWGTTSDLLVELGRLEDESLAAFCDWAGPELAPFFREKAFYNRGLLHSVVVGPQWHNLATLSALTAQCERLFRIAPIRAVVLWGGTPQEIRTLLFRSEMVRVETLELGAGCWQEDASLVVDALTTTPNLSGLRKLTVHSESNEYEWDPTETHDQLSATQRERLKERFGTVLSSVPTE